MRPSLSLRPRRLARPLAGLRLSDAGRGRLFVVDRRARRPADADGVIDRRSDERAVRRFRPPLGDHRGARNRAGSRSRRQPVRLRLAEPFLSRDLVSECRPRAGPRAALRPSLAGAEPALSHPRRFIFIMCNKEKFWPILCRRLGRPQWAADPRFRTFKERLENRSLLNAMLDEALAARTTAEWLNAFAGEVPAAPVNDLSAALDNPFVRERGRIRDYARPGLAPLPMVAGPVITADPPPVRAAPALGADTEAVLAECGLSQDEIMALRAEKVI